MHKIIVGSSKANDYYRSGIGILKTVGIFLFCYKASPKLKKGTFWRKKFRNIWIFQSFKCSNFLQKLSKNDRDKVNELFEFERFEFSYCWKIEFYQFSIETTDLPFSLKIITRSFWNVHLSSLSTQAHASRALRNVCRDTKKSIFCSPPVF